jgi:hypothetical protein
VETVTPSGAVDVVRRDDWPQLCRDIEQVRDGYVDVDAEGFAT